MPTSLKSPQSLPPDIRLMNGVSALLCLGFVLAVLALGVNKLVRLPALAIRTVQVDGDVSRNSEASLRANALPRLQGGFLNMNLANARQAFESVPWVRRAVVQRVWPGRLHVSLEEHKPAAYWELKPDGADAHSDAAQERSLINTHGEVFHANLGDVEDEDLPVLSGPTGAASHMLAMWQTLSSQTRVLDERIERLDLSGRGSWKITWERGGVIELGRGTDAEVQARYAQFVGSVTQITSRFRTTLLSADLRHHDGYAARLRGVSTTTTPAKGGMQKH